MGKHLISDNVTLSFAEIIDIIIWHNWNKRGFPSENDTSYFRLYHYYTDYVTIISVMRIICIISTDLCLLPVLCNRHCVVGRAHLGHHVPEESTMYDYHVQWKTRTCCCSDLRIQSQGSISFCDDPIRSRYRSQALRQRGEFQLQHYWGLPTGDDNSRRSRV